AMVAEEHAALVRALASGGIAVLNADDGHFDLWRRVAREAGRMVIDFALDHTAAVSGRYAPTEAGSTVDLATPDGHAQARLAIPGRHNAANALAATAAGLAA